MQEDYALQFMMIHKRYFSNENLFAVKKVVENMSESELELLSCYSFKDPLLSFLLSLFVGVWGVDRFYVGDIALGILKLITFGGFGLWLIVDWCLIMKVTKKKNFEDLINFEHKASVGSRWG